MISMTDSKNWLTLIAFVACTAMAIWNLGWLPDGPLSAIGGGVNAFIAGGLAMQWITYRQVDRLIDRAIAQFRDL